MTGDKKDPTIDENLARIRELVESVKKPESEQKQDSENTSHGEKSPSESPPESSSIQPSQPDSGVSPPSVDEGTTQNLARKGAVDSASRTPLTDYVTQNMPQYLDTPNPARPNPDAHVDNLPTADNGFNEPFVKATVNPIGEDEKPAPFVTGVGTQQIKPREATEKEDEIPDIVMQTLMQSDEKGKVHIRSGINAPAFTSPHNVQISINRDNRRTLEEISKKPQQGESAGNVFADMQKQKAPPAQTPSQTAEPLVLTDVLTLDEIVSEDEQDNVAPPPPLQQATPPPPSSPPSPPTEKQAEIAPNTGGDGPDKSVLVRIRTAMEHLKQVHIEKEPFDTAVRDMVETEVRPYVKKWVNDNIADVVERQVDTEIQKILNKI